MREAIAKGILKTLLQIKDYAGRWAESCIVDFLNKGYIPMEEKQEYMLYLRPNDTKEEITGPSKGQIATHSYSEQVLKLTSAKVFIND